MGTADRATGYGAIKRVDHARASRAALAPVIDTTRGDVIQPPRPLDQKSRHAARKDRTKGAGLPAPRRQPAGWSAIARTAALGRATA
jgi:hypothetical protein